jgi:hypothetical protein
MSDPDASFHTDGSVAVWDCRENPIPNSKVEWQIKDIGLGIKTKVPVAPGRQGKPRSAVLSSSIAHPNWSLLPKSLNLLAVSKRYGRPDSWFESRSLRQELNI